MAVSISTEYKYQGNIYQVEVDVSPGSPPTNWEPGEPDEIEITSIEGGPNITDDLYTTLSEDEGFYLFVCELAESAYQQHDY